ncbi:LEAF RUST 10 DISEASE-RESISTANCE LOCUS RECEPTOR-LIKE PROTEIN KINASE-like 2.5 isoform X2 [Carex rostrata]
MKLLILLIVLFLFYNFGGSSSSSCGELRNITYPSNLRGACLRKAFELQCNGNDTVLYFEDTKYLVKDMSVENETLRLVDPYMAVGECRLPNQTFPWDQYSTLLGWHPRGFDILFFNCTEEVEDSMYKQIHCMDGPDRRSRVYAVYSYNSAPDVQGTLKSCKYVGRTVADSEITDRWNDIDAVDMMQMLRRGVEVSWNFTFLGVSISSDPWDDNEGCSLLQFCWSYSKSEDKFLMGVNDLTTGQKLQEFLSIQSSFLQCIYQPEEFGMYEWPGFQADTNPHLVFGFMLILIALLDILLLLLGVRLTLLPLSIFVFLLHKYKRESLSINSVEKFLRKHETLSVRRYDFVEIASMTNHFREKLGQGGFGSVYKGKLFSGCEVAVKILTNSLGDGNDFISEVATLGRIHHVNIVRLIGFCSEDSKRALVYPYMPKGSLDKYIFSSSNNYFALEQRREIAVGIARGIDYLHRGCQMQILHFDIKPHNILLDHDLTPKISDFGLAKLYSKEYNLVTLSTARGTIGYIAPELISRAFGVISHKADVYSFGMLLMEMVSGRRNVDNHAESSSQVYYPSWIYDQLKLADEPHNYNLNNSVAQFGEIEGILYKVAFWCIQMRPSNRPSMSRVIEMLQSNADSLEMPPKPFTTDSSDEVSVRCSQTNSCSIDLSAISEEIGLL